MLHVALIHPPAFRTSGDPATPSPEAPISDVVSSTPVFDIYSVGFPTVASYLEGREMQCRHIQHSG
jgi:hypothetical protein